MTEANRETHSRPAPGTPEWKRYWDEVIAEAQKRRKVKIGGKTYDRIKYGEEGPVWVSNSPPDTCGDCGCTIGQYHVSQCDMERCPKCGGQALSCRVMGCNKA